MRHSVTLSEPIQFGSQLISELEFRKPKAKDLRTLPSEMNIGALLDLAGILCGQPKAVIDELCIDDVNTIGEIVRGFMQGGRETTSEP
jgi:hypothetical protein